MAIRPRQGSPQRHPVVSAWPPGVSGHARDTFHTPWEDYFTLVQWDQRGTGKTYRANTEAAMEPGMGVDGTTNDAAELVQYLR